MLHGVGAPATIVGAAAEESIRTNHGAGMLADLSCRACDGTGERPASATHKITQSTPDLTRDQQVEPTHPTMGPELTLEIERSPCRQAMPPGNRGSRQIVARCEAAR